MLVRFKLPTIAIDDARDLQQRLPIILERIKAEAEIELNLIQLQSDYNVKFQRLKAGDDKVIELWMCSHLDFINLCFNWKGEMPPFDAFDPVMIPSWVTTPNTSS